jgi:hypothetical protein
MRTGVITLLTVPKEAVGKVMPKYADFIFYIGI